MRTEFQKPTLMPLHSRPVHADDQALTQASIVGADGSARMLPSRISSMGLSDVTDHDPERQQEEQGGRHQEGIDADAADGEAARAAALGLGGDHARLPWGRT